LESAVNYRTRRQARPLMCSEPPLRIWFSKIGRVLFWRELGTGYWVLLSSLPKRSPHRTLDPWRL